MRGRETLSVGENGLKENAPEAMVYEIDWIWGSELGFKVGSGESETPSCNMSWEWESGEWSEGE